MGLQMIKFHHVATITALLCCTDAYANDASYLVKASARSYRVPVDLAMSVAQHETGVQCGKVGRHGERGPLQILPSTAKSLGYPNIKSASCATQTDAGMKHLAICWEKTGHSRWLTAACHNQGFSALTGKVYNSAKRYANAVMQ